MVENMLYLLLTTLTPVQTSAMEEKKEPPTEQVAAATRNSDQPLILIQPKARAEDFAKAFELLKKSSPTSRILLQTYSGQTLTGLTDITVLPNGTLVMLKLTGPQGLKTQILPVDDLKDLTYAP